MRHLDYNPDWAQKLISSSMSRHLLTCNMSSKSMHAFLSNLANRQKNAGENIPPLLLEVKNLWFLLTNETNSIETYKDAVAKGRTLLSRLAVNAGVFVHNY